LRTGIQPVAIFDQQAQRGIRGLLHLHLETGELEPSSLRFRLEGWQWLCLQRHPEQMRQEGRIRSQPESMAPSRVRSAWCCPVEAVASTTPSTVRRRGMMA
jgi:hypothetical protein